MDETVLPPVVVRRSQRRRSSVSARREGDRYVVSIPAHFTATQEAEWVSRMTARLHAHEQGRKLDDESLARRADELSDLYLGGAARPDSVRWVTNQGARWGSCTPSRRTIRVSHRLAELPDWVLDYVLVHELAHLLEPSHNVHFWALVGNYPRTERARGFLEGVSAAGWLEPGDQGEASSPEV